MLSGREDNPSDMESTASSTREVISKDAAYHWAVWCEYESECGRHESFDDALNEYTKCVTRLSRYGIVKGYLSFRLVERILEQNLDHVWGSDVHQEANQVRA